MESVIEYKNLDELSQEFSGKEFFITDSNVFKLYPKIFLGYTTMVIDAGEKSKNINTVIEICGKMIQSRCDRKTIIIAVGGGVVGDIAGFCAAIFMRGIQWINIPTTLLAQVDSSIGGKTGIDFNGYKNILGAFILPKKIIVCNEFLFSLPSREWTCGMGEVIKTAMLDANIFKFLQENYIELFARDNERVNKISRHCSEYKQGVICRDFLESGERKNLNIGHTVGHALESSNNYALSHGEYVLWGLKAESFIFKRQIDATFFSETNKIINNALQGSTIDFDPFQATEIALSDKKNYNDKIFIVTCVNAGITTENALTKKEFLSGLQDWRKTL